MSAQRDSGQQPESAPRRTLVSFPDSVLRSVGARTLDPVVAPRLRDQTDLRPTAYVGNSLLVAGLPSGRAAAVVRDLEAQLLDPRTGQPRGRVVVSQRDLDAERVIRDVDVPAVQEMAERVWVTRVSLEPVEETGGQLDAFDALQRLRALRTTSSAHASLNHVVGAGAQMRGTAIGGAAGGVGFWGGHGGGVGFWGGHGGGVGFWGGHGGPSEYAAPGFGGRMPVAWAGIDPCTMAPALERPPVVVLPDTGLGAHEWFGPGGTATVGADWHGLALSAPGIDNPDAALAVDPLTGALQPLAGHGTFIAGLIRQGCPQARILSLPVMQASGAVVEGDLHEVLALLLLRHVEGQETGNQDLVVDVLSLSLGYYHESPADEITDQQFHELVAAFVERGVVVVAAAGNDSTDEPLYPAGFTAPLATNAATATLAPLPIASVGSLNASPASIALFSNAGTWVNAYRQGAAVVSTMPTNFQGPGGASTSVPAQAGPASAVPAPATRPRGTMDPDDFSSGFGVWSGTSFAAPILAAEAAASLVRCEDLTDVACSAMTARAASALDEVLS
jgi:Subtilase family